MFNNMIYKNEKILLLQMNQDNDLGLFRKTLLFFKISKFRSLFPAAIVSDFGLLFNSIVLICVVFSMDFSLSTILPVTSYLFGLRILHVSIDRNDKELFEAWSEDFFQLLRFGNIEKFSKATSELDIFLKWDAKEFKEQLIERGEVIEGKLKGIIESRVNSNRPSEKRYREKRYISKRKAIEVILSFADCNDVHILLSKLEPQLKDVNELRSLPELKGFNSEIDKVLSPLKSAIWIMDNINLKNNSLIKEALV